MQRDWSADELGTQWSLRPEDTALLAGMMNAGKLGFAAQLACWRQNGRFPAEEADIAPAVVAHLATQIGVGTDALQGYAWAGPQRAPAPPGNPGSFCRCCFRRGGRGPVPHLAG